MSAAGAAVEARTIGVVFGVTPVATEENQPGESCGQPHVFECSKSKLHLILFRDADLEATSLRLIAGLHSGVQVRRKGSGLSVG